MTTVAEGLVLALRSLPAEDKKRAISILMEDADVRQQVAELLIEKLLEPQSGRKMGITNYSSSSITSKERGKRLRVTYLEELRANGVEVTQVDSVWAKTAAGVWAAIPTATMEWRPSRWFLGLPETKVRERIGQGGVIIVLLCQAESGSRLDFIIPPQVVQELLPRLSRSAGQLKFNLKQVGNQYQLVLPRSTPLDVSSYKGNISVFRSQI